MATNTATFTADGIVIPDPVMLQLFSGNTEDTDQILAFVRQAKKVRIQVTNNPIIIRGAYGNQAAYARNLMFEGEIELPIGVDWMIKTALRGMAIKSATSGNSGHYEIEAWYMPTAV